MKKLSDLLRGLVDESVLGARDECVVTGVFDDSRRVQPGGVFVAIRGTEVDGRRFISDAVDHGAAVVIGEGLEPVEGAQVINVPDARAVLAELAARWHGLHFGAPDGLTLIGVTGTNGKTTVAFMTCAILRAAGWPCGMLGTVNYDLGARSVASGMTTPGPLELANYLRECAAGGTKTAVLEVSSHALDQKRTDGVRFAVAAFTNLSGDHLDYHKTFEAYRAAKARLFSGLDETAVAVVNRDDVNHGEMIRDCRARIVTYALKRDADLTARISRDTIGGTLYHLHMEGCDLVLENALAGQHNVYNALAAAASARALGVAPEAIEAGLSAVRNIPGRLQRVPGLAGVEVFVDYAHTDDALRNVLSVLGSLKRGRLIVVFGCGGDRDRTKRPRMARAAEQFADLIIVTSDNPRMEDPRAIIDDILGGFGAETHRRVLVEEDRRGAIRAALGMANEGDVVLIAGKGHEDYQILGTRRVHFDDVEVTIQTAAELAQAANGAC